MAWSALPLAYSIPQAYLDNLIECPRTVSWMERLASKVADVIQQGQPGKAQSLSIFGLVLRYTGFDLLVLLHGFRRLTYKPLSEYRPSFST